MSYFDSDSAVSLGDTIAAWLTDGDAHPQGRRRHRKWLDTVHELVGALGLVERQADKRTAPPPPKGELLQVAAQVQG
jgi:hypothetical protein